MDKQKIALDTNVVFKMLDVNAEYEKNKVDGVTLYKSRNEQKLKKFYETISNNIDQTFSYLKNETEMKSFVDNYNKIKAELKKSSNDKEKAYLFDKLCDIHKSLNGAIDAKNEDLSKQQKYVEELELKYKNAVENGDKNKVREFEGKLKVNKNKLQSLKNFVDKFNKNTFINKKMFEDFNGFVEDYKDTQQNVYTAHLFEDSANGKVELCIPVFVYRELRNHYREGKHIDKRTKQPMDDGQLISRGDAEKFLSRCTLVTFKDKEILNVLIKMKSVLKDNDKFKTTGLDNKKYKEYLAELNSLGQYGDLMIVSLCNIAGIPSVSHNEKHMVGDTISGIENLHALIPNKRNYFEYLKKNKFGETAYGHDLSEYTTRAYPYTFSEYFNGDIKFDTPVSNYFEVAELSKKDAIDLGVRDAKYFKAVTMVSSKKEEVTKLAMSR